MNKVFTARAVERLRPGIDVITHEMLDVMAREQSADLMRDFAYPLPMSVLCELLGVPVPDRDRFHGWVQARMSDDPARMMAAAPGLLGYLHQLVEAKRHTPAADLLTDLVHAGDDDGRLSPPEVVATTFLLLVAGHETTVNLIGNGTLALLRHPDQLAALRADPSLMPSAIEEFLRYEGPLNTASLRYTTEPLDVGGVTIPRHDLVAVALTSANRDDAHFPDATRLDVTRTPTGHLAFGHGIHYCVGAPWPAWKDASPSPRCSTDSPRSTSPATKANSAGAAPCSGSCRHSPCDSPLRLSSTSWDVCVAADPGYSHPMLRIDIPFATARLVLRPFRPEDTEDVADYQSRPDVARFMRWEPRGPQEVRAAVEQMARETELTSDGDCLTLAVVEPGTGTVVGQVELVLLSAEHRQGELGCVFHPAHQGKGFATEAASAVLRLGFDAWGLHRVIGRCHADNAASAGLLERLGMRREARFIGTEFFKGAWRDDLVYAMLRREWSAVAARR
ncbi:GNAT family N-acetyltransferase [Streptomyces syringium]|uniref:RimJ/RimL family protein N-acetyltransferase n=1 Tax=Streptomyces syringium TaxID=76729 RepID=A0ABS4XWF8_9ACTN|nr:GNAT family N-acetyltransferase [Streptomyces syringium]MBP2400854.1 RimJ/RimL family protein N-acetyltransferase [Streptomyces syringium]